MVMQIISWFLVGAAVGFVYGWRKSRPSWASAQVFARVRSRDPQMFLTLQMLVRLAGCALQGIAWGIIAALIGAIGWLVVEPP